MVTLGDHFGDHFDDHLRPSSIAAAASHSGGIPGSDYRAIRLGRAVHQSDDDAARALPGRCFVAGAIVRNVDGLTIAFVAKESRAEPPR